MLVQRLTSRGVTLIELVIGLLIVSLVMGFGVPSFSNWIQNAKIRTATEAAQNGLQLARAEAVKRNTSVRFQFVTTTDNNCALSTTITNWVVSLSNPTGHCADTPQEPPTSPSYNIQVRPATEGSSNVAISTPAGSFTFNSLGRLTSPTTSSTTVIDFTSTANGASCAPVGELRCLRLVVSIDGQILMCDPAVTLITDTRKCP